MNKKTLQFVLAVLGLIPIITGGLSILLGMQALVVLGDPIPTEAVNNIVLDSETRFLGAIWFGIGVAIYWLIPSIDKQIALFRLIAGSIFLGGIGRLLSAFLVGVPPVHFFVFIVLELIGMPLLVLWHSYISGSRNLTSHPASK
jgi:hypothetical protein